MEKESLRRWDDEGGAVGSPSGTGIGPDFSLHADEERVLRYLGAAVITQWIYLPTEIQRILFADAASVGTAVPRFELKQQIARFLRDHKGDG